MTLYAMTMHRAWALWSKTCGLVCIEYVLEVVKIKRCTIMTVKSYPGYPDPSYPDTSIIQVTEPRVCKVHVACMLFVRLKVVETPTRVLDARAHVHIHIHGLSRLREWEYNYKGGATAHCMCIFGVSNSPFPQS